MGLFLLLATFEEREENFVRYLNLQTSAGNPTLTFESFMVRTVVRALSKVFDVGSPLELSKLLAAEGPDLIIRSLMEFYVYARPDLKFDIVVWPEANM